jgi:hypothetical protein
MLVNTAQPVGTLDDLLDQICVELQLTDTQYLDAAHKYDAIGNWLSEGTSPLVNFIDRIDAQGSMALGTTVKPRDHEEFDLDLLLLFKFFVGSPLDLRNAVVRRMLANGLYRDRLDLTKPRCIRVLYKNQFYLDIVPARPDYLKGGAFVEVPDKELKCWIPSNPRGYIDWFESQCRMLLEKAAQAPLPPHVPARSKPVLKRAVQLLKRHRDVAFDGSNNAPSSILLTTLGGHYCHGEQSIADALVSILSSTLSAIQNAWPDRIMLSNPSNEAECLTDRWTDESYMAFVAFIKNFREALLRVTRLVGLGHSTIVPEIERLFDEGGAITKKALNEVAKRLQSERLSGDLRATGAGLAIGKGITIPRNKYYGRR